MRRHLRVVRPRRPAVFRQRWLVFSSAKAGAIEVIEEGRLRVAWRYRGTSDWWAARSRFDALMQASWLRGLRGIDANFCLTREWP